MLFTAYRKLLQKTDLLTKNRGNAMGSSNLKQNCIDINEKLYEVIMLAGKMRDTINELNNELNNNDLETNDAIEKLDSFIRKIEEGGY